MPSFTIPPGVEPRVQELLRRAASMAADGANSNAEVGKLFEEALALPKAQQKELFRVLDQFHADGTSGFGGFLAVTASDAYQTARAAVTGDVLDVKDAARVAEKLFDDGKLDGAEKLSLAAALLVSKMTPKGKAALASLNASETLPRGDKKTFAPEELAALKALFAARIGADSLGERAGALVNVGEGVGVPVTGGGNIGTNSMLVSSPSSEKAALVKDGFFLAYTEKHDALGGRPLFTALGRPLGDAVGKEGGTVQVFEHGKLLWDESTNTVRTEPLDLVAALAKDERSLAPTLTAADAHGSARALLEHFASLPQPLTKDALDLVALDENRAPGVRVAALGLAAHFDDVDGYFALDGKPGAVSEDDLRTFLDPPRSDLTERDTAAKLRDHFAPGDAADCAVSVDDLRAAQRSPDNDLRAAARTLLAHPEMRARLDTSGDGVLQLAELDAVLRAPRSDLSQREVAERLEKHFDKIAGDDAFIDLADLQKAVANLALPLEARDAACTILEAPSLFRDLETAHFLSEPDGKASVVDLHTYLNPPRSDMSLQEAAAHLEQFFAQRGLASATHADMLNLQGDTTASLEMRGAARSLWVNQGLFDQMESAFNGQHDGIVGAPDFNAILRPNRFGTYGIDYRVGGKTYPYRFQPDPQGWVSDHFFVGSNHGRVFYNVESKAIEVRELNSDRSGPLMAEPRAGALRNHAQRTIFNVGLHPM